MHIAVDLDDVVLDFCGALIDALNTEYDAGLTRQDINEWDLHKILDPIVDGSWWSWWRKRDWLWARATAVPGSIGGLTKLRADGHYLEIVTSKPEWAEAQTWRWLGKWRPPVHAVTIVGPDDSKAAATCADLLIDDKPGNVEEFNTRQALLFTRTHNLSYNPKPPIFRANGWRGVLNGIDALGEWRKA